MILLFQVSLLHRYIRTTHGRLSRWMGVAIGRCGQMPPERRGLAVPRNEMEGRKVSWDTERKTEGRTEKCRSEFEPKCGTTLPQNRGKQSKQGVSFHFLAVSGNDTYKFRLIPSWPSINKFRNYFQRLPPAQKESVSLPAQIKTYSGTLSKSPRL